MKKIHTKGTLEKGAGLPEVRNSSRTETKEKNIKYLFVLLAELAIIIFFVTKLFMPLAEYNYDYSEMEMFTKEGRLLDGACFIDEKAAKGYTGMFTYKPFFRMSRGSYRITLEYSATTPDNTVVLSTNSYTGYNSFLCNTILLSENQTSVTFNAYISEETNAVQVVTRYGGTGDFAVKAVSIEQTRDMFIKEFVIALFVITILNVLLYLNYIDYFRKLSKEKLKVSLILAVAVIISSYPLLADRLIFGSDLVFHLFRIESIKDGIMTGNFPVKIDSAFLEGHGYAASVFYGDALLYFPALLRILGFSIQSAYMIFVFCINIATCVSIYWCLQKMLKQRYIAALGSVLYILSPYRLHGLYHSHTIGETSALIFIPLIIYGLYRIFTMDVSDKEYRYSFIVPAIGYCGLINTHILSTEITGVFTILLCLVCIRRTLKPKTFWELLKTAVTAVILAAGFIVPFADYFLRDLFNVNSAQTTLWIQEQGLKFSQLIQMFPAANTDGGYGVGTPLTNIENPGIAVIILAALFIYNYYFAEKEVREKYKPVFVMVCFGIMALFMSTCYFPWDLLRKHLDKVNLALLVNSIQYPSRLMQMAVILLIIPGCFGLLTLTRQKRKELLKNVLYLCTGLLIITSTYYINYIVNTREHVEIYDLHQYTQKHTWSQEEYLPKDTDLRYLTDLGITPLDGLEITDYENNNLDITFKAHNSLGADAYVDIPVLYYRGYTATDDNGNVLNVYNGRLNNLTRVDIPANYSGGVHVYFKEPALWRAAEMVSLVAIILLAGYAFHIRRKNNRC